MYVRNEDIPGAFRWVPDEESKYSGPHTHPDVPIFLPDPAQTWPGRTRIIHTDTLKFLKEYPSNRWRYYYNHGHI